jgi:hypothetical protein
MIELIKTVLLVCVPTGLVVWLVHNMMSKYIDQQRFMQLQSNSQGNSKDILQIKLQAYERLALCMERIDIRQLLVRIRMKDMTNNELQNALIVAVQQEYEHNMIQQLYVSDNLWEIIKTAKENILKLIMVESDSLDPNADSQALADSLIKSYMSDGILSIQTALKAIKQETRLLL